MGKRKPSARTERRTAARAAEKLARDRQRLARVEPGGTPQRPIQLESASQVEPHAMAMRCLRCDGPGRLEDHSAVTVKAEILRAVVLRCTYCGTKRELWFRIAPPLSN